MRYNGILLILLIMAVLAVAGCLGSDNGGTTPAPPAGSPVPAASWNAVSSPSESFQLFNQGSLHWYQYRYNIISDVMNVSYDCKLEYDEETHQGIPVMHMRETSSPELLGGSMIIDIYVSKINNSTIGGHKKSISNGKAIIDEDISTSETNDYLNEDYMAYQALSTSDVSLTDGGQDTATIDGKAYACTKYTFTNGGTAYTAWYTPQAPAPVFVKWITHGSQRDITNTLELVSWG